MNRERCAIVSSSVSTSLMQRIKASAAQQERTISDTVRLALNRAFPATDKRS